MKFGAFRGAASITIATALGQVITLAVLPILSRLYSPSQFGALSFVLSIASILAPIATLRFDYAVVLPRSQRVVRSLVSAVFASSIFTGLATALVLIGVVQAGLSDLNLTFVDCILAGLLVALTALQYLLVQLTLRDKQFGFVAGRNIVHSLSISATQLGLAPLKSQVANGLILGSAAGTALGVLTLLPRSRRYLKPTSFREVTASIRRYWRFPAVFVPSSFMVFLTQQGPLLIIIVWFGASSGGQMGMAERVISAPLAMLGLSIGSVFRAHMAERIRARNGDYSNLYVRVSLLLLAIGFIVGGTFFILGPWLLPIALGKEWVDAGEFTKAMAITAGVRMVVNPTRSFVDLFERARLSMVLEFLRAALLGVGVLTSAIVGADALQAVWTMLLALTIADVATWICGLQVCRSEDRKLAVAPPPADAS
ncbi:oligosaccharide flippase family protein [Microbacterium sp. AGC85]